MRLSAKIGVIEFAGGEVRLAVVKTGGRKPTLCDLQTCRIPHADEAGRSEAMVQATRDVVSRLKSKPSAYVLCADSRFSIARILTIPLRGRSRVGDTVQFELEQFLAFPIEEIIVDHSIIREVEGGTEVLTVGMRKESIAQPLAVLNAVGIDPEGIGLDAAGLTALWLCGQPAAKGLNAVLHVRDSGSILAVVHNKVLAFLRPLSITAKQVSQQPAAAAREVNNSLRSFTASWKSEKEPANLTVTGVPLDADQREEFESAISVPVSFCNLADYVHMTKSLRAAHVKEAPATPALSATVKTGDEEETSEENPFGDSSVSRLAAMMEEEITESDTTDEGGQSNAWEALVGVALGAAGGPVSFNFRQGDLAQPNPWRRILLHGVFTTCLAALLVSIYAVFCYVDYRQNKTQIDQIGAQVWDLYTKAFPMSKSVKGGRAKQDIGGILSIAAMKTDYQEYVKSSQGFNLDLLARPTLLDILNELSQRLPGDKVQITDVTIRPSSTRSQPVTIMGELKDPGAYGQAFEKLRQSEILKLGGEPLVSSKPEKTTFTIAAST